MPRLPEVLNKADLPADKQPIFDLIAASRGKMAFPFSLLLNSPEAAGRIAHLGHYLRFESVIPPVDLELAILTTARQSDCEYEWAMHVRLALAAGVRDGAIDVIAQRGPLDQLTAEETLPVRYARELLQDHRVSEAAFEAARAKYGPQGVTELTALVGYYTMIACALNAFQVPLPAGGRPLPLP